ncbi:hypothetical protein BJ742DRAFT_745585 [Cladochytrium replicatum]|nr:hypothetical protein BJ742DRAFT_745585 [Cladochytrium replicatum]
MVATLLQRQHVQNELARALGLPTMDGASAHIQEAKKIAERAGGTKWGVIHEHRALDNFIKSQSPKEQKTGKLSEDVLTENVFTLLFAGYDTSGATFGSIRLVTKMYEEAKTVFKAGWDEEKAPFGAAHTFDSKTFLTSTHLSKKSIALYPSATVHVIDTKTEVQLGDYHFAPNTKIMLMALVAALKV